MNAQKISLSPTTVLIVSEQIKNKSNRNFKYAVTKNLEEKLDEEERTEEQKCEVLKKNWEDLNYYNDDTNTRNTNQLKKDDTENHGDTTVSEHDQTSRSNANLSPLLYEMNQRTSLLREELKIKVQIGKAHQNKTD